ncbi:MAG: TlpA family protein disulfide reductase [Duncaniella sp.]|nr:TlpA family protein disulfide reductase [Duncaniella sp.]
MKRFKCLFLMAAVGVSGMINAQQTVKISGKVGLFNEGDKMSVMQRDDYTSNTLAEAPIQADGTYVLEVPVTKAGKALLLCGNHERLNFWLEDEDITADFAGKDTTKVRMIVPKLIEAKGGPKTELYNWCNFIDNQAYKEMINTYNSVRMDSLPKSVCDSIITNLRKGSRDITREYARRFVRQNPTTTSVVAFFPMLSETEDSLLIENTLDSIIKANPDSRVAQNYRADRAEKQALDRAIAIGAPAPDLTFNNLDGKPVSISSFKGKVLIVDFWASWCGPCRAEIPSLKKIYDEFKDNDRVAFLSISIDSDKDAWLKAVKKEAMPWEQLLAPNAGQQALKTYQISGIPHIICIAEDGTIFRKGIRGDGVRTAIVDALAR